MDSVIANAATNAAPPIIERGFDFVTKPNVPHIAAIMYKT